MSHRLFLLGHQIHQLNNDKQYQMLIQCSDVASSLKMELKHQIQHEMIMFELNEFE